MDKKSFPEDKLDKSFTELLLNNVHDGIYFVDQGELPAIASPLGSVHQLTRRSSMYCPKVLWWMTKQIFKIPLA